MIKILFKLSIIGTIFIMGACGGETDNATNPGSNDPREREDPSIHQRNPQRPQNPVNPTFDQIIQDLTNGQNPPAIQALTGAKDIFKVYKPGDIKETFADVSGLETAKESLKDIIDYLSDPVSFRRLGAEPPMGVLFYGPPGTGKTAIARAFAGEVNKARKISYIVASGASFENKYVGVGADNVRKLFALARQNKPAIIFIDEFDAVAGKRTEERKNTQMVNQLLTELDGFDIKDRTDIFLVAATNHLKDIDPAVQRAGRIDSKIEIPLPDAVTRKAIIEQYLNLEPKITGIDINWLIAQSHGWNAADIKTMVNKARIHATVNKANKVDIPDFQHAINAINKSRLP